MKIKLSGRAQVEFSGIRKVFQQLPEINNERIANGLEPIIDLTIGQPHLPVNPVVLTALQKKLKENNIASEFGYSQVGGRTETLEAVVALYSMYYPKVKYTLKEVMCTNGAVQALWNALSIFIEEKKKKKDVVLIFEPYFGHYIIQVAALGGKIVKIPALERNFHPTAEALEKILIQYPDAKILLLNYPNNPSGVSLDKNELEKMVKVLKKYPNIAIILDEVYHEISFCSHTSLLEIAPEFKNRTIVIHSGSKGLLGAPDLRVGMAAGPSVWIEAMCRQQLFATSSVSYLSQIALTSAINSRLNTSSMPWKNFVLKEYQSNIEYMAEQLNSIGLRVPLVPKGAFYILVDASCLLGSHVPDEMIITKRNGQAVKLEHIRKKLKMNRLSVDTEIAALFLYVAGVAAVPGSSFGLEPQAGFLRISCAKTKEFLELAIKQLKEICTQLFNTTKIRVSGKNTLLSLQEESSKNLAIIGAGNVGEWFIYMLLNGLVTGDFDGLGRIYLIGRNSNKLQAKIADQLHAFIIAACYEKTEADIIPEDIERLINKISCTEDYSVLGNVHYIITAFGAPMSPDIRERSDLLFANYKIAIDIARKIKVYANRKAFIINLANPLDVITWCLQELSGFPSEQVAGVSGILDVSRLAEAVREVLKVKYQDIDFHSLVVVGQHGNEMVPLLSQVKVLKKPLFEKADDSQINAIIHFTAKKGTQIMENLGKIPPHISTARAILVVLKAVLTSSNSSFPCSVWNRDCQAFMGSLVKFKKDKIVVEELDISLQEKEALMKAAFQIKKEKNFVTDTYRKDLRSFELCNE